MTSNFNFTNFFSFFFFSSRFVCFQHFVERTRADIDLPTNQQPMKRRSVKRARLAVNVASDWSADRNQSACFQTKTKNCQTQIKVVNCWNVEWFTDNFKLPSADSNQEATWSVDQSALSLVIFTRRRQRASARFLTAKRVKFKRFIFDFGSKL